MYIRLLKRIIECLSLSKLQSKGFFFLTKKIAFWNDLNHLQLNSLHTLMRASELINVLYI